MEDKTVTKNRHPALFIFKILWKIVGVILNALCEDAKRSEAKNLQTTHDMLMEMADQDPSLLNSNQPKKNEI